MRRIIQILIFSVWFALASCVSTSEHESLQKDRDKLHKDLADSKVKVAELETLVAELERKLGSASASKKSMSNSITHMKTALKEASARKREIEKRMNEYRKLLRRFKSLTDAGALSIKIVDGKMVVALPSDVLFNSGSAKLSSKGDETVTKVSELLASIPKRNYQVEGHTDNVPISSAKFPSNWELAAARAVNVVKNMVRTGMPKERISAASYSDTKPVASNESKESRSGNRRIEIVVVPDLSQLPGYDELNKISEESQ